MRAVVQRVTKASVTVNDELISSIGNGLCVLVGIGRDDADDDINYIVRKILNLKLWSNDDGKRWSKNVVNMQYEVLLISQFTLYGYLKGNSPDFHQALPAPHSKEFFERVVSAAKLAYKPDLIKVGSFGNYMQVHIQNDGPVTINLESPLKKKAVETNKEKANPMNETDNGTQSLN